MKAPCTVLLHFFGLENCERCKQARSQLDDAVRGSSERIHVSYVDTATEDGLALSDLYDIFDVPTILIFNGDGEVSSRWDNRIPTSCELTAAVKTVCGQ